MKQLKDEHFHGALMSRGAGYLFRVIVRWALLTAALTCVLLFAAGSRHIFILNIFLAGLAVSLLLMMLSIAPNISHERQSLYRGEDDKGAGLILILLLCATLVTGALDVGRLHFSNQVPVALSIVAVVVFVAASGFQSWAMSVNSFYSAAIYIQQQRGHNVITQGPYRIVRHPAYFANIIAAPACALAIGSWVALLPAILFCALTVWRARLEDDFLRRNLTGYIDYAKRVQGCVFPRFGWKF